MNIKILFIALLALSLTDRVNAQTKRKVVVGKTKAVSAAKSTLSIEAGLVFKNGDVKSVARTEFYLLDKDLETILSEAGIEPEHQYASAGGIGTAGGMQGARIQKSEKTMSFVDSYFIWAKYQRTHSNEFLKAQEAIKPHIISTVTTDFSGKGVFPQIKGGKYVLLGFQQLGQQAILWNMPIEVKAGSQSITLDNNNASEIL